MRGGFRTAVSPTTDLSDDELIEQTRLFRRAFNSYYRIRPCADAATRFAESLTTANHEGELHSEQGATS